MWNEARHGNFYTVGRLLGSAAAVLVLITVLALTAQRDVAARADERTGGCSTASLRGDYGILVSGIRGAGPGRTESFVGTAFHSYDGNGNFEGFDNTQGQLSGAVSNRAVSGTYEINPDCSGTVTMIIPGVPVPIVTSIVLVDHGREIEEAVMSPAGNLVTAVQHRVR
jgi:hypothetical protein